MNPKFTNHALGAGAENNKGGWGGGEDKGP